MPTFRPNTWDANIWNSIVEHNEYGIINNWPHNIIDIGGHIGSFTYFMLQYKQSYMAITLEPDFNNFSILQNNLKSFIDDGRVITINGGIGPVNSHLALRNETTDNTGGLCYSASAQGNISSFTLDSIIDMLDDSPILLKLDCEGCEYEALSSCTKLFRINAIVGEFHENKEYNYRILKTTLENHNFVFSHHHTSEYLGLFGAHQIRD